MSRSVTAFPVARKRRKELDEFPGFRSGVDEVFALLGCYTVYVCSCLPTFRGSLSAQSLR